MTKLDNARAEFMRLAQQCRDLERAIKSPFRSGLHDLDQLLQRLVIARNAKTMAWEELQLAKLIPPQTRPVRFDATRRGAVRL